MTETTEEIKKLSAKRITKAIESFMKAPSAYDPIMLINGASLLKLNPELEGKISNEKCYIVSSSNITEVQNNV